MIAERDLSDIVDALELGKALAKIEAADELDDLLEADTPRIPRTVTITMTEDTAGLVAGAIRAWLATREKAPGGVTDQIGRSLAEHHDAILDALIAAASDDGSENEGVWQRRSGPPLTPSDVAAILRVTTRTVTERCGIAHRAGVAGINRVGRSWSIERDAIEALR